MRSTAPSKRDIVLIVPRHGGGPPPSSAVLKKARLIAKKKGKRLLPPLNVLASQPAKESEHTHPSTLEEELVRACGLLNTGTNLFDSDGAICGLVLRKALQTGTASY
jgi:hypothetical protein